MRWQSLRVALLREPQLLDERAHRRHAAEALEPPPEACEPDRAEVWIARDVTERHDLRDARLGVRVREREVAHPGAVGRDAVAHGDRHHERADRRGREDRLRHLLRLGLAGRIDELVVADVGHVERRRRVGRDDDELDLRFGELSRERDEVAESRRDRVRQRVLVQPEQRQLPEPVRTERLVRLEVEHERLELLEPVERRDGSGERACGRPVDPADARPE